MNKLTDEQFAQIIRAAFDDPDFWSGKRVGDLRLVADAAYAAGIASVIPAHSAAPASQARG